MPGSATEPGAATRVVPGDPARLSADVADRFTRVHGHAPRRVTAAPGRVNLVGEHTDYNSGLCLPIALPHATYVAAGPRTDGRLVIGSTRQATPFGIDLDDLEPAALTGWPAYAAGVVWAAREAGVAVAGLTLEVDGTVPLGAGLSSSASLECAVALAVLGEAGLDVDDGRRAGLVEVCTRAEREAAGAPTGGMDQTVSLLARAGHALLLDCRDGTTEHVAWAPEEDGVALLVVDTRATHSLNDGGYGSRRDECDAAARFLGVPALRETPSDLDPVGLSPVLRARVRHVTSEIERVRSAVTAVGARDWRSLGAIFTASHASLRDDFEVSCPELDLVCDTALEAGALGARMTGGGFGGSAVVLAPRDRLDDVAEGVARAFVARGWTPPGLLDAPASAGARTVIAART